MSHVARVGSRSPSMRIGIGLLYLVLVLGAITTVYPFLLMVSTATKSQTDYTQYDLVPRYWFDDKTLYVKYLEDKYANNLDDLNAAHGADYPNFPGASERFDQLRNAPGAAESVAAWNKLKESLPMANFKAGFGEHDNAPSTLLLRYRDHLRKDFGNDIRRLNAAWTEENVSFDGVTPPFERSAQRDWKPDTTKPKVADWEAFKKTLPRSFLLPVSGDALFRNYLKQDIYEGDIAKLNASWQTAFSRWEDVVLTESAPDANAAQRADRTKFLTTKYPTRLLATDGVTPKSPEIAWRAQSGTRSAGVWLHTPQANADARFDGQSPLALRWDFATRNFRSVFGQIFLNGRAVLNTVIFCALAILGALVVNPLCAYALSRYPLPYAYQVLLFLLATMAFPAEVAMIPNFLLLKELGLLNTFGALVLPTLANGFSIFLLKGFFDSLPKELYEAALLDGATEITMFRRITIPLSLPIFSVIALNAFTASYGAFLFALVVCQDPKMWTLMVWLYNLQATAPQYVIMAALTLAALPTLIVFLFAQKVILRGIVLPSFK